MSDEKIIYKTTLARVPVKAHEIMKKEAKRKGIRITEAYVQAAEKYKGRK